MLDVIAMVFTIISLSLFGIHRTQFVKNNIPVTPRALLTAFFYFVRTDIWWVLLSVGMGVGFMVGSF